MARTIGPRSRPFAVRTYSARGGLDRDCLKWINSGLDGQTLNELCACLDMTRQAVSKHLGILEEANLVATVKQGREKLHYLNPGADPRHRRALDREIRTPPVAGTE
jgi:DNA-binding transcriptional ArsR family regulator